MVFSALRSSGKASRNFKFCTKLSISHSLNYEKVNKNGICRLKAQVYNLDTTSIPQKLVPVVSVVDSFYLQSLSDRSLVFKTFMISYVLS